MTSSMTTGERSWASARRGGMTVLGKVAVPKPINLPSQRLENHGNDPNVEIVPKGTLSWGSRPSSANSNAWGTSALSPSTDGSSSSPSHLVGRPSSSGGTRPSTAASESAHDSNVNVWSANSRPSSASGVVVSNNASLTSLRPRSADTRPGSSHLSRFAEPLAESSGAWAWASSTTSERIGVINSAKDGFSLSSGDFPTLGSEKDESSKNMEPLVTDHRRPGSSSGVTTTTGSMGTGDGDDSSRNADFKGDSWRKDGPSHVEDWPRPSMERSYGEPHPYQNPNMAPPHYESWHDAPPANPPGGVWYRAPPGHPPYGVPGTPGGFPMEPFPYYRPAPGLANSQPIPPPGSGPHGHHSKNGDLYRPHMSESYMGPGMPIRPGFYRGPVPYEGYYGPPMGYCHPSERDLSFMGMAPGPPVYNRPVNPRVPDPNNSHPRPGESRAPDKVEPGHPHDPRGNYKALRKQNDDRDQNDEHKWGHKVTTSASNHEKGILSKASVQENAWGDGYKKDKEMHYGKSAPVEEVPSQSFENKFGTSAILKLPGRVNNVEDVDVSPGIENATSPRDHSLIQKIEGLNAKARDRVQIVNDKANRSANDANSGVVLERHPTGILVPVSRDTCIATVDKSKEITVPSETTAPRRPTRGAQSRGDHHGKGSFNGQEADGWKKKSESRVVVSTEGSGYNINDQVTGHHTVIHPVEVPKPNAEKKGDGESVMSTFDPNDIQRAKMKEIAKQRAIQLQQEEEERIKEQKAKALAKLEELDRRSANQATENSGHKVESVPPNSAAPHKQEMGPTVSSMHVGAETKKIAYQDSVSSQNQLPTADVNFDDAAGHKTAPQVREVSKKKRAGHKQRQNPPPEKNSTQNSTSAGAIDVVKDLKDYGTTEAVAGSEVASVAGTGLAESPQMFGSPVHQKKKNKSGKNKLKVEESSTAVSKDSNHAEGFPESAELNFNRARDATQSSENHSSLTHESVHVRQNNSWKPQHSRKPRNLQGNRSSEKSHSNDAVVWAPVGSYNKVEATDRTNHKTAEFRAPSATGDNMVNNNPKAKRAEMERYIPKPVAKELAQQGSIQQSPSPSVDLAATDRTAGRVKSSQGSDYVAKAGFAMESKQVNGKHRQRAEGSWQTVKSYESLVKGPEINVSDEWNTANESGFSLSTAFAGMNDHVPSGRGKRHPFKGHKGSTNNQNMDHKDPNTGLTDLQPPPVETSQTEKTVPLKETRAVGDRAMSHWQPKSQGYVSGHNQHGNRSRGSQNFIAQENKALKWGTSHNRDSLPSSQHTIACEDKGVGGEITSLGHQERQRPNSQSGYQPMRPYNNSSSRSNDSFGAITENQPGGQRSRERGQSHSRRGRGNFYGRQRSNPTDAGNE